MKKYEKTLVYLLSMLNHEKIYMNFNSLILKMCQNNFATSIFNRKLVTKAMSHL